MKALTLILGLALAPRANADIADSGNLTIGGQAVVAGTMTVQGNAFSVGGSTFQVAGGSVTLGGQLQAAAAGIRFADGTVQVSSPPAAAVMLAGTNPFTGTVLISTGGHFGYGGPGVNTLNISQTFVYAQSIDGVSQSSGCFVEITAVDASPGAALQFTSTTTATLTQTHRMAGVLLETCAPLSWCRVGISGIYRLTTRTTLVNQYLQSSSQRCAVEAYNNDDGAKVGTPITPSASISAGGFFWAKFGRF